MGIQIGSKGLIETLILVTFLGAILPSSKTFNIGSIIRNTHLDTMVFATSLTNQYGNVTYEGNLVIDDNETFTIEDSEFYMIGKITVKDTSALIIRNSKFTTIPSVDGESIVLMNQANLIVSNTTVIFKHPGNFDCKVIVQDYAKANITHSELRNRGLVVAYNSSEICVNDSTITTSTRIGAYPASGVATFDTSTAKIKNSTMDGLFVWDFSTISIENSVVAIVRTAMEDSDMTAINVTNSRVDYIEVWGGAPVLNIEGSTITGARVDGNASVWFQGCSVTTVSATGNARTWLIDSYYEGIEEHGNAKVFVGWHLAWFGPIVVHYAWIPLIQLTFAVAILATIITILLVLRRRRVKRAVKQML